jgi:hypothetical protein
MENRTSLVLFIKRFGLGVVLAGIMLFWWTTASASQGACVMRDGSTNLPLYTAPDNGSGYSMRKLGTVLSYDDANAKCTDDIFQQLAMSYCQSNSNTAQWQVASCNIRQQWQL